MQCAPTCTGTPNTYVQIYLEILKRLRTFTRDARLFDKSGIEFYQEAKREVRSSMPSRLVSGRRHERAFRLANSHIAINY
jgi:hypothetical protein